MLRNVEMLHEQIKATVSGSAALTLKPAVRLQPERMPCGIEAIDELLNGGLPTGVVTEFVGAACSGRTTTALAYISAVTQAGAVCAWIDASDALEPDTAAASGVDLERLLWVRCGDASQQRKEIIPETLRMTSKGDSELRPAGGGMSRIQSHNGDMPDTMSVTMHANHGLNKEKIGSLKRVLGTPGMPNRPISEVMHEREEQVNTDRLPPRRGDNLSIAPRSAEPQPKASITLLSRGPLPFSFRSAARMKPVSPWQALNHALHAADLLLLGGGFSVIVLDLASMLPEIACRIPLATWFRFRSSCERNRTSLVLLTQHPCAGNSAEIVVRLQTGIIEAQNKVMTGIHYQGAVERKRSQHINSLFVPVRKPHQQAGQWKGEAAWARLA